MSETLPRPQPQPAELLWEIDRLNETAVSSQDYFSKLLSMLTEYLGASCGRIWHATQQGLKSAIEAVSQQDNVSHQNDEAEEFQLTSRLANEVFHSHQAQWQIPDPVRGEPNPSNRCFLLVPLYDHANCFGVASFVVEVSGDLEAAAQLDFLEMAADRVRRGYLFRHFQGTADQLEIVAKAQQVTTPIGKHLEAKPLSYEVVNRLHHYVEADRVSLAFKRGKKCTIKGVSNQAVFERRSNVIRGLERLAARGQN